MSRDFKGIWVPDLLVDILGIILATKISAYHASLFFNCAGIQEAAVLSREDIKKLVKNDVCEMHVLEADEVVEILENKKPQKLDLHLSLEVCGWCECLTAELHKHHYPLAKSKGGKKTVPICPNCHSEFHRLSGRGIFMIKENYKNILDSFYLEEDSNV